MNQQTQTIPFGIRQRNNTVLTDDVVADEREVDHRGTFRRAKIDELHPRLACEC